MESINALRTYVDGNSYINEVTASCICSLLDGIEREVDEMLRALTIDAKPMTDENMAEHGWVRLPVDADGVPIRVGDVMEVGNGRRDKVRFLALNGDGWSFNDKGWVPSWSHHHKPTVEDVLMDLLADFAEQDERDGDMSDLVAEYAAKLRLVGDAE